MPIPSGSPASLTGLKRGLLVRHLQQWASAALQRSRRITYAHGYADLDDAGAVEDALRALGAQPGLVRGREIVMVAVADDPTAASRRLAVVQRETVVPAAFVVHAVPGGTDARIGVALKAAGATRTPLFGYLDASGSPEPPALATVGALTTGRPAEVLLVLAASAVADLADGAGGRAAGERFLGAGRWCPPSDSAPDQRRALLVEGYRSALRAAGFPLVCAVEVVIGDGADGELLVFATESGRSLETYKDALWAAGAAAGVRFRDPGEQRRRAVDVVPPPDPVVTDPVVTDPVVTDPVALRPVLAARLSERATVTELRTFVLTETVYRAADASRALTHMLADGLLVRQPAHGRLGGDVVITRAEPAVVDG